MHTPQLDASFFRAKRQHLLTTAQDVSVIVVAANGLLQRGGDSSYEFHQDSSFYYLCGIDASDLVLVVSGKQSFIIAPKLSDYQNIFDGRDATEVMIEHSGIDAVYIGDEGWDKLKQILPPDKKLGIVMPAESYNEIYAMYANPSRQRLFTTIETLIKGVELIDVRKQLAELRVIKSPIELELMKQAIAITCASIQAVAKQDKLALYTYETQLAAAVQYEMMQRGADGLGFSSIVSSGNRATILHNMPGKYEMKRGDLIVIDVGADIGHYCADISRTVALGEPSKRQQAVFSAVKRVSAYAQSLQKPGVSIAENESKIEAEMGKELQSLGLINEPTRAAIRQYFPHATSHFLGLDPHDVGDYRAPLRPGMVLTVEPGIYIKDEGIGVRIEDDILITEEGFINLSKNLPTELSY